jgi:NAD(P)-dependent dehydrogenase (short-subunit alcohol dehydrogenase family)
MPDLTPQQQLDLTDRVVLVTGGGSGLGAGIATRFAQAGADLVVSYRSNADGAAAVCGEIEALGRRALAIQADVSDENDVSRLFTKAITEFGRVSVVINNAGIYPQASVVDMTPAEWDATLNANLRGVFLCTQAAARQMANQLDDLNAILNIASIEGSMTAPLHSHYIASKAGVIAYTRAAALELGPKGIRVNAVSPGLIWRKGIEDGWPEGVSAWQATAPLSRLGQAQDVADACIFLASRAASWITGINLPVDGGMLSRPML